ncbi:MAG: cytochrome c oxidase subunit I [Actinomycetota bacterium]
MPDSPKAPRGVVGWLTTTDHKQIGIMYMVTAFIFFLIAGALAILIRAELARPGLEVVSRGRFNQLFTMHGSLMMFLFAVPIAFGLANYLMPLQLGAPDMAFPRLNALSYWLYLAGGVAMTSAYLTTSGGASFGWTAYTPLSGPIYSPGAGADLWIVGLVLTGTSSVLTAVNLVATALFLRAPGMTLFRMPIFTWNMLITSFMVLIAFPVITAALALLYADRHLGSHFFDGPAGTILWQHLFWFFGHPEVYIVALPYFGVITEIIPVFSRKPVFGYKGFVFATLAIAGLSIGVWGHHMFTSGAVLLPFFSGMTMLIAVPTGVKYFNWIGTMWKGQLTFPSPMLFSIGFLVFFLIGGLTGVMVASPPIDFQVHDTYFIVAHMHYVLFGAAVFALFAGLYFWFPKFTGRRLSEGLAHLHFWPLFIGSNLTFFPMHMVGLEGMPRRVADYTASTGWGKLNLLSSIGAAILGVSVLPFLWNVWRSLRHGELAGDDPWEANHLEWATTSPPPEHNFDSLPPINSERPVFDMRHASKPSKPSTPPNR